MIQYLFAAYSLDPRTGGANNFDRGSIRDWRDLILSVAKEEMGHLLTVQNVLCLLGAPVEFARENHPWDSGFYPFRFNLQRLTIRSLAQYLWAEMPDDTPADPAQAATLERNKKKVRGVLGIAATDPKDPDAPHVAKLYREIIEIISDQNRIRDADLNAGSYRFQASWDDWGRGHSHPYGSSQVAQLLPTLSKVLRGRTFTYRDPADGRAGTDPSHSPGFDEKARMPGTQEHIVVTGLERRNHEHMRADVIVVRVATRRQAIDALLRISEQGEAASFTAGSHYDRFARIMNNFNDIQRTRHRNQKSWEPTHRVADNPSTQVAPDAESAITWPRSVTWATLFNLRYRMLLTYLGHTFHLARDDNAQLRGAVTHRAFAEMYNLKAIAGILVQSPLKDPSDKQQRRAGPPFEMPDSLSLPPQAIDRWRLHGELIDEALGLNSELQKEKAAPRVAEELVYLRALQSLDTDSAAWIEHVISGLGHGRE